MSRRSEYASSALRFWHDCFLQTKKTITMKAHQRIATILLISATIGSAKGAPSYLTIGDQAPSLKSALWIKGGSVPQFEKGRTYLVEFWATWCHPCRDNIPHLTELAHRYSKDVTVVGISIWEKTNNPLPWPEMIQRVQKFVDSQGSQMDYVVGMDSEKELIANSYMRAAGEGGIPCSYIVNREGKVAWIGHPANVETALKQVLAGTNNIRADREQREVAQQVTRPVDEALAKKDYRALIATVDNAVKKRPNLEYRLTYPLLVGLYHADLPRGIKLSKKILKDSQGAIGAYQMMTSLFATEPGLSKEAYTFGLKLADEGMKLNQGVWMFKAMKGEIYLSLHQKEKAIELGEQAVALAQKDANTSDQGRALALRSLEKFRAAK